MMLNTDARSSLSARLDWVLRLLILCGMACWCTSSVQIVPRFISLPPTVSYFIPNATVPDPVDLICRAWPPNAKLYLLATQLTAPVQVAEHGPGATANTAVQRPNPLLPIPQGLASQRYAVLTAAQLSATRPLTDASLRPLIGHETLLDAIRERPAAAPSDEVAVRLTVTSLTDVRQLEVMRLHCLVATAFGRLLSSPFHIIPTSLGDFPRSTVSAGQSNAPAPMRYSVEFLSNNIALIDCHLPLNSFPIPTVQFELNGTVLDNAGVLADRYRQVLRHDGRRVSLLIHKVQAHDQGVYRCVVTNPLTGERKYSPEETHLKLVVPTSPVQTRIVVPLASTSSLQDQGLSKSQEIIVNEGENVTLFCIIQSAPPPTVATYPFDQNFTHDSRFQLDEKFGLLRITNVKPKDAGFYMCSDRHLTSTSQLRVNARLRFEVKPQDVKIGRFGDGAQFKCASSDAQVTPYWLFNGQPKTNSGIGRGTFITIVSNQNTLTITNVTASDLGVYQCVAHRKSAKVLEDEWISVSATLTLESDNMVRTPEELATFTPKNPQPVVEPKPEITTKELTPKAEAVYDNLAVYLIWKPLQPELSGIEQTAKQVEYRLDYSVQTSPVEEQRENPNATQPLAALVGLVGHEAVRWSDPTPLKQQASTPYAYVTGDPLKPSRRYRFRVTAVDPSTGVSLFPPSDWSNVVSMEHISAVEPPQIKMVRPLSKGRIHLMWAFDGTTASAREDSSLLDLPLTVPASGSDRPATSADRFPGLEPDSGTFVPDHFLVLARPLVKPKSDSGGSYEYGAYWATQINGSNAREGMLVGLNRTASYQVIVYGVRGEGDRRQITRFSKAAYVNLATADHAGSYSLLRSLANNRLMYIILGGIAAIMFLVVFVFILLCLCRQHRDRRESTQRKKQNGFVQSYKDTTQYMPVSTTDGTNQRVASVNNQSNGSGGMLMMSNLQCSAFSDHSASNHGGTQGMNGAFQQQQQQQQAELKQQQQQQQQLYMQQQQADQYAAAMAMSKEMMQQQQHQSMLGSQMHLHQPNPQNPMVYHHPQHHQSHHSLLFPSSGQMHQVPTAPMYQSGTLPGGPRYMRQGFTAAHHQFGSQQPLNRATTPAQGMMEVMDYHMQPPGVYAHQQPQLPPVPHPQTADLPPPHHLMMNSAQRSMGYYPGPMTPSGTSLKREPPTGGSLQDGSAYGTLLQRGQLTGSVIHDPSLGPISPPVGYAGQYYHGSQQALHLGQAAMYPSGMASPQPGHGPPVYSPPPPPLAQQQQQQAMFAASQQQQQQQQAYPGYYGQAFSPQPDGMGHASHGFGPTDGESIYSYFSQQDMGQSNPHQPLNPLPEENQAGTGAGFVDSGMQTGDGNGHGPEGSPAGGGGSHRHHRRRRRKQQQQQQQQQRNTTEMGNGSAMNDQGDSATGDGAQFAEPHSNSQLDEHRPSFDQDATAPKRQHSMSAGTYSDADPNSAQQSFNMPNNDGSRPGYMRFDSPQRGPMFTGQMPPPNQPPPPPPPPAVALGLSLPGLVNGMSSQDHPGMHHNSLGYGADSLSRRPNGAPMPGANGTPGTGGYSATGPGLLVGPPPRIRDYSEYGIPRGIGLPPTPAAGGGGQPQPPQHVLMSNPALSQHGTMMYEGRYREGQA